ncbi:transposase [Streptomyces sp. NPDC059970]|uniref:transposase n=1 Tax=Streptomyces sp. NPDC059970 TaxID=3347019 RepID=UPI0036B46ACC
MAGVITASAPSWIAPFTGLSPRRFSELVTAIRREQATDPHPGRPWSLSLEDRVLLVTAYWRTNLTMRQLAPLFGISKSSADRIIDHLGPMLALQPRKRFRKDTLLIVDGTLVPTRDHTVAEQSKNYRYSTAHQVVIDADTRRVVVVGRPLPGNRHDSRGWEESGAKAAVGNTMTIADGGYQGTGLVIPHRRRKGEKLPSWKEEHNRSHKQVRARVVHTFARMKTWQILRDCRLKGEGVHHGILGVARLHNLALAGQMRARMDDEPCPHPFEDHLRDKPWPRPVARRR